MCNSKYIIWNYKSVNEWKPKPNAINVWANDDKYIIDSLNYSQLNIYLINMNDLINNSDIINKMNNITIIWNSE